MSKNFIINQKNSFYVNVFTQISLISISGGWEKIERTAGCLLLIFGLACAAKISAQTNFIITGNVQANNQNLAGTTMILSSSQGGAAATATTDANGNYTLTAASGGNYSISVYKRDYNFNPAYQTFVNLQSDKISNFRNGVQLCPPPPAGQGGGTFCQGAVGTSASAIQNGKIAFVQSGGSIATINADGSTKTTIFGGHFPSFSPDGSKIVFDTNVFSNREEIYTINADGSGLRRLTNGTVDNREPHWSPDGTQIVFTKFVNFNTEIFKMNADGTGVTQLTSNSFSDDSPSFSPDGSKIVFSSNRDGGGNALPIEIYVMNSDGSNPVRLTFDLARDFYPSFSPDGSRILFTRNRGGEFDQIWTMSAGGNDYVQLTNDQTFDSEEGTWSPDGTKIAFSRPPAANQNNTQIYMMNALFGSVQTNLTNDDNMFRYYEYPSWQRIINHVGTIPAANVSLDFSNVTTSGNTVATPIANASAGALPFGFYLSSDSTAYDIRTSASFSGSVDVCFNAPNGSDQTAFNNLHILHNENGVLVGRTTSRDFSARRICATVTSLSPFILVSVVAPTAASVSVAGRVLTPTGRGLANATVLLTNASGELRAARTNSFGYYRFEDVAAGQTYVFNVRSKRYQFSPQVINITEDLDEFDFTAGQNSGGK